MFSSNQCFQISGTLDKLSAVIDFAVRLDDKLEMLTRNDRKVHIAYQITNNGLYCLGTGGIEGHPQFGKPNDGWTEFPFDYDPDILAGIIRQWIEKQPRPDSEYDDFDGGTGLGFLCFEPWNDVRHGNTDDRPSEHIRNIHDCIVCFKPYVNYYAK